MIRVLQFADIINRHDFIDNIVRGASPALFRFGICVRSCDSNIATPSFPRGTPRWVIPGTSRCCIPLAAWRLARILRQWRVDILHTHHYEPSVIGWLATRLYRQAHLVVGRHYSDSFYRLSSPMRRKVHLTLEQQVNRAARKIIAPSKYICQILCQWQGVSASKVELVPYGFMAAKYPDQPPAKVQRFREDLGLSCHFVVATFGRLHEEKGQRFLIQAIAQLHRRRPELRALLVGEGPERRTIEKQIDSLGLGDIVQMLGWRRDAMTVMAAVDAVVQPTLQEGFSQVMAEALWMRKPLVITDVSGAPDIITDGQNGLLVPRGDTGALATAIERLAADEALRARLAKNGREYVQQRLTVDKIIPLYEEVYLKALDGSLKEVDYV